MKTTVSRRFYSVVLIYVLLALTFLFLHLFRMERISGITGNLRFTGYNTRSTLRYPEQIRQIKLYFNGIELSFSPFHRLKAVTSDGISHPLQLESMEQEGQTVLLHFSNDVTLRFISDTHSKKVTLSPELPLTIPPMEQLLLPSQWMDGFELVEEEGLFQLVKAEEELSYYLTAPANTVLEGPNNRMVVDVSNNILRDIVLEETLTGTGRTLTDWYEKEGDGELQGILVSEIQDYRNDVFLSIRGRMENNGELTHPENGTYFSERALTAVMTEALDRNQYQSIQRDLGAHTARNRARLSYRSAPYLGDIVVQGSAMVSSDWRLLTQVKPGLEQSDFAFFQYNDLYSFFGTQLGLYNEQSRLTELAWNSTIEGDNFLYQLNRIEYLLESRRNTDQSFSVEELENQLQEIFLSNVFWIREDLLLFDQQGVAQMEASLRLGAMLYRNADILDTPLWTAAGIKMILSVLKYSDELAYLPEELIYNSSGEPEIQGEIPPENAYEILSFSPFTARREDLREQLGPGSWAYTAAEKFSLTSTPRETIINVDFPVDHAHHMVIRGVKPFYNIYLHGIRWNSDRNFQHYSDGWLYDADKNILYIKLQHRRPTETIQILYYDREATQAAAATPE